MRELKIFLLSSLLNWLNYWKRDRGRNMESYEFIVKSRKEDIDFINKIIEAYEGLGVVRTTNAKEGLLTIITTDNFKDDLRDVIVDLGKNYVVAEILEEGSWKGKL